MSLMHNLYFIVIFAIRALFTRFCVTDTGAETVGSAWKQVEKNKWVSVIGSIDGPAKPRTRNKVNVRCSPSHYRVSPSTVPTVSRGIANGGVFFRVWTECTKNNEIEMTRWPAGEEFGMRDSCSGLISEVTTPTEWEEIIGDLPKSLSPRYSGMNEG